MKGVITNDRAIEIRGLSSDTKPVNKTGEGEVHILSNGSIFFEMDTLKVFFFDEENNTWIEAE